MLTISDVLKLCINFQNYIFNKWQRQNWVTPSWADVCILNSMYIFPLESRSKVRTSCFDRVTSVKSCIHWVKIDCMQILETEQRLLLSLPVVSTADNGSGLLTGGMLTCTVYTDRGGCWHVQCTLTGRDVDMYSVHWQGGCWHVQCTLTGRDVDMYSVHWQYFYH